MSVFPRVEMTGSTQRLIVFSDSKDCPPCFLCGVSKRPLYKGQSNIHDSVCNLYQNLLVCPSNKSLLCLVLIFP